MANTNNDDVAYDVEVWEVFVEVVRVLFFFFHLGRTVVGCFPFHVRVFVRSALLKNTDQHTTTDTHAHLQ